MSGLHARRYSRIRERRAAKVSVGCSPRHRKTTAMLFADEMNRAITSVARSMGLTA